MQPAARSTIASVLAEFLVVVVTRVKWDNIHGQ